ncbi:MAG: DNA-methyltransferase [Caldicoprobacterales bacterium]|jgi:site-specific DNA-methyltransferase (adenine-specific)
MGKKKADRNKTIDIPLDQGQRYLKRCIKVNAPVKVSDLLDQTIQGNTFEVVKYLPEKSVDLIIADPPYNLSKVYHGYGFAKKTHEDYEAFTRKWLGAVLPLLKDNGSIYVCCDWESSLIIGRVMMDMCIVRNRITWQREKGRGAKANWKNSLEDIWYATMSQNYTFNLDAVKIRKKVMAPYRVDGKPKDWMETDQGNFRDTCPSNFWDDITIPFWSMAENTAHPTQKSEKLIAKIMLASSNEGDIVLDPFLGSGTTSVVSKKLGRRFIGIEENPLYCVWTEKRLEMADRDSAIQGYADGVFWDRNTFGKQKDASAKGSRYTGR